MAEKSPPAHEVILFVMCWRHNSSSIPQYIVCHVLEAFPVHAGLSLPELTGLQVQFLMQSLNGELSAPLLVLGV